MKFLQSLFVILILLVTWGKGVEDLDRTIKLHDIINYMTIHKEIIEETQSLYVSSIDNRILGDLNSVLKDLNVETGTRDPSLPPLKHIGKGRKLYLDLVGEGNVEMGPDVDSKYMKYCNSTGTTLHLNRTSSLLLCKSEEILEVPSERIREKRSIEDSTMNDKIREEVITYIKSCKSDCIISKSLKKVIEDCMSDYNNSCFKTFLMVSRMLRDSSNYQPSIQHFFDNHPYRKSVSLHTSLEQTPVPENILQTIPIKCDGSMAKEYVDGNCIKLIASDMNAIYKLFNNKVENESGLHVIQTSKQYKSCEPQDHIWKDAKVTISLTGEHDSVMYRVKAINVEGANVTMHCLTTICNLCIVEVPILLKGDCTLRHAISNDGHILKLCNKEKYTIGYFIRLLHGGSRLDTGYSYRSKFLIMNLYTYAHEKIVGSNIKLTEDSEGPQIIKGTINKDSCEHINAGNIGREWLQYYVKCGQRIYHHNEYLSESYRCNLKYQDYKLSWIFKWICYNWYYIRFFLIIMSAILLMYMLWFIGIYKYIALFLCMITSPLSYVMYKYWPYFARCTRCGLPWMPWHKCNEICLCGEKFSDEHKSSCEFYQVDKCYGDDCQRKNQMFEPVKITIPDVGSMNYINHVRSQRRQLNNRMKNLVDVESNTNLVRTKSKTMLFFQAFSSFRNPFTVFTVRFSLFLVTYIILCILVPVSIAECIKCTDTCHWNGNDYTEDCGGLNDDCNCIVITNCNQNKTKMLARSFQNGEMSERELYNINGCIKGNIPYETNYFLAAFIEIQGCYKNVSKSVKKRQRTFLKMSAMLPTYAKLFILERESTNCKEVTGYLNEKFDLPYKAIEETGIILNTKLELDQRREMSVRGFQYANDKGSILHDQKDFEGSIKPIQDVVEESKREEIVRKNGELLQEFHNIINLLNYNGSIFGRDHNIVIPHPPSFIQHIYTAQSTGSSAAIDMSMQAIAGSASAFRPIHNGKEIPLTFIISVPEVAGVYAMKYLYTACKTSTIDSVRYDKCVGTCASCFEHLDGNVLDSTKLTKFHDKEKREKISFDNPNTWGCEGSGCWTINTGCLCSYCSNIPDPNNCFDVYAASYHGSKALVCLSINEDYQCEHVMVGKPIEKKGKVQLLLQGSDEWSSLIKSEMVAIGRGTGKIMTGLINGLGESSGNFGSPQYSKNLTLVYKVSDVEAHYVCNSGSDQEVVFDSCFKDTWPMLKDLKESAAFFLDSKKEHLYHIGKNIGTLRIILNIPVEKIEWKTVGLNLNIRSAICIGCYGCVNGIHCNAEIESTHSGMVYVYTQPCVIRVSTINILRGTKRYNITIDCMEKPISPYLYIRDGNDKTIAKKALTMTINEGNTPRTTERNSTNHQFDITGQNSNTLSSLGDFFKRFNPISAISNFFSSSLVHWILYAILTILIISVVVLACYYVATVALRRVTNKVIIGKQE